MYYLLLSPYKWGVVSTLGWVLRIFHAVNKYMKTAGKVFFFHLLKFIFSKKATKIDEIFTVNLTFTKYIASNRR